MQRKYYITGFMGSGKTTVGQALAKKNGFRVIDVDQWIEEKEQQVIKDIFAEKGESYFRQLETSALEVIDGDKLIITTGGGIIMKQQNRKIMKKNGVVIYLQCELDEVLRRLEGDDSRPNLRGDRKQIEQLFETRKPYYEEADISIDTTGKSVEQIVEELMILLK